MNTEIPNNDATNSGSNREGINESVSRDQFRMPKINEAAEIFWAEHVMELRPESWHQYRYILGFVLPKFGKLKPYEMTDKALVEMAEDDKPLVFFQSSRKENSNRVEDLARLWDTRIKSKSKRPWSPAMKAKFLRHVWAFRKWCHFSVDPVSHEKRNWCPPRGSWPSALKAYSKLLNAL